MRAFSVGRASERRQCRWRYIGLGQRRPARRARQEDDVAGTSGPHRRRIAGPRGGRRSAFWSTRLFGLSAFVGAGLVFAGLTDTCGMGMLLARMPWNQVATDPQRDARPETRSSSLGDPSIADSGDRSCRELPSAVSLGTLLALRPFFSTASG